HAFALLHRLGDVELDVTRRGDDAATTGLIDAWATRSQSGAQLLLSNYTPPGLIGQSAPMRSIELTLRGLPQRSSAELLCIDAEHANLLGAWQAIGSPPNPTPAQVADLAGRCALQPSAAPPLQQAADGSA